MYYIGLEVHKRAIRDCVKDVSGRIHREGSITATRTDLDRWRSTLPQPWMAALEATVFTGWISDHLVPPAAAVKVAPPLMLRAISGSSRGGRPAGLGVGPAAEALPSGPARRTARDRCG